MAVTKKAATTVKKKVELIVEQKPMVEKPEHTTEVILPKAEVKTETLPPETRFESKVEDVIKKEMPEVEHPVKKLDEFVIKEIMHQKGVDRDAAIEILSNPTK